MQVGMLVEEPRDDRAARHIDHLRTGGDPDLPDPPDSPYPVLLDEDRAVLDHLVAFHGHDPRARVCRRARRLRSGDRERDLDRFGLRQLFLLFLLFLVLLLVRVGVLSAELPFGGRLLLFGLGRRQGLVEGQTVIDRTEDPCQRPASVRPPDPLSPLVGELPQGKAALLERDLDCLGSNLGERRDVGVVQLVEGDPAAVGRDGRLLGLREAQVRFPVRAVELHGDQQGLGRLVLLLGWLVLDEEDPLAVAGEGRPCHPPVLSTVFRPDDVVAGSSLDAHPVDLVPQLAAEVLVAEGRAAPLQIDDLRSVGREGRVRVLSRVLCQLSRRSRLLAPGGFAGHDPDIAAVPVVPGDEGEELPVGGECRAVLEILQSGQSCRGPRRQVHDVEVPHGREDEPLAVGGFDRPTDDPGPHGVTAELVGEAQRVSYSLLDGGVEGNTGAGAGGSVPAPDLPIGRGEDRAAVGSPGEARKHAMRGESLLLVPFEALGESADLSGVQLHHLEHGLGPDPADVGEALPVGRGSRCGGASELAGQRHDLSCLAVETLDLPDPRVNVAVVAVAAIPGGEVDEPAVG